RVPLQELVSEKKRSVYHVHCLFGAFGNSKLVDHDYFRPRIHKANVAICLDCMKLIYVDNVKPTKTFHYARNRYVEIIEPKDLMINHWNNESKDVSAYAQNLPEMFHHYSTKSWADAKKYQLRNRLYIHILNLLG
ncbi:7111_t:CDS:2, partial [Diversispora eburnea]